MVNLTKHAFNSCLCIAPLVQSCVYIHMYIDCSVIQRGQNFSHTHSIHTPTNRENWVGYVRPCMKHEGSGLIKLPLHAKHGKRERKRNKEVITSTSSTADHSPQIKMPHANMGANTKLKEPARTHAFLCDVTSLSVCLACKQCNENKRAINEPANCNNEKPS
jgi:hypothetical protein